MARANAIRIDHIIEVKKKDIARIKKEFNIKNDEDAIKMAIDIVSGNLELKNIFKKHKGI